VAPEGRAVWRLVDSGIISPERSAAADEAILNARGRSQVPDTLHFYIRDRPTVSIGYNRQVAESVDLAAVDSLGVSIVRRLSGGSAVYTDQGQLIFSLALSGSVLPSDIEESYALVCSGIVRGLSSIGIEASYKPINDVLVDGCKISGSAQLRRGGFVLHHGTLLVDTDLNAMTSVLKPVADSVDSPHVPKKLTCLRDLMGFAPVMSSVKKAVVNGVADVFDVQIQPGSLTEAECAETTVLVNEKYGRKEWNWRL
jgi:lipoate-protein ligase A